jgi:hypothetical protein
MEPFQKIIYTAWLTACCLMLTAYSLQAQGYNVFIHRDMIATQTQNTATQYAYNELYNGTLTDIKNSRNKTMQNMGIIEEVQRTGFKSLSNVDGAVRNGKTLYYAFKKAPKIFDNLAQAAQLSTGKPYLLGIVSKQAIVFEERVAKLTDYIQNFVCKNDETVLINPTDRSKFVNEVYTEINILYNLSAAMVNDFKIYNLQDAINKVYPWKMYYNMDKNILKNTLLKLKFLN